MSTILHTTSTFVCVVVYYHVRFVHPVTVSLLPLLQFSPPAATVLSQEGTAGMFVARTRYMVQVDVLVTALVLVEG